MSKAKRRRVISTFPGHRAWVISYYDFLVFSTIFFTILLDFDFAVSVISQNLIIDPTSPNKIDQQGKKGRKFKRPCSIIRNLIVNDSSEKVNRYTKNILTGIDFSLKRR